jgi:anti-sigma regulatory factor (Ser/Thr protein kinase)
MVSLRTRGERIRRFILDNVAEHPSDIVRVTAAHFGVTRQAAHKHVNRMVAAGFLTGAGTTSHRIYALAPIHHWRKLYPLVQGLAEDEVWRELSDQLGDLPSNIRAIWQYGFTEMFNNAIDHSGGTSIVVDLTRTAVSSEVTIDDDGVGIFDKIKAAMSLSDARHAVLELAKGKLTTDPARHSGEGIFFTSRAVDEFYIVSGGVFFGTQRAADSDWVLEVDQPRTGTLVRLALHNHTSRTLKSVFDEFAEGEEYGFTKTIVPVILAKYGDENLVSRSQAKRVLSRVEAFKKVVLDFKGVGSIGQAFADEIFRVFALTHPEMSLVPLNAEGEVHQMIRRAVAAREAALGRDRSGRNGGGT